MNNKFNNKLEDIVSNMIHNYTTEEVLCLDCAIRLPNRNIIIEIIKDIRQLMFPKYFAHEGSNYNIPKYFIGQKLSQIYEKLTLQIQAALSYKKQCIECETVAQEISMKFLDKLPIIQKFLIKDVQAAFDGDPAAKSKEDIIFSYPGLFAIFVYRVAHELYKLDIPFIPRIMSEYAHNKTGIDINSGAVIGESFFIDHGTGVVIGETTNIGDNVKIYQGVTLGALSTRNGQLLAGIKRHPTIEDNVTIYSGASILGGETVIGKNSIIGGNAFIVQSVPPDTRVSVKSPELTFKIKSEENNNQKEYIFDWVI